MYIFLDKNSLENLFKSQSYVIKWGEDLEKLANEQIEREYRNDTVIKDVEDIFINIYKGLINIIMYGSRVTGLATKDTSDIDILIDTSKLKHYSV